MGGSTLQVRTRTRDSPWQENVDLKTLSAPDYSTLHQSQTNNQKAPHPLSQQYGGSQVAVLMEEPSKSSITTTHTNSSTRHNSQEQIPLTITKELIRRKTISFARGFICSVGIERDYTTSWSYAILVATALAIAYGFVAYGSLFFVLSDFASVWPANGIYAGGLLRCSPRTRRALVVTMAISIYLVNLIRWHKQENSLIFTGLNSFECILVASFAYGLVRVILPKKISLLHRKHLIACGLGILIGCLIAGLVGSYVSVKKFNPGRPFGPTYLKYIGRNIVGSALLVPVIMCVKFPPRLRDAPKLSWRYIRAHPRAVSRDTVVVLLLLGIPALCAYLINGSALSAVGGLYITYPVVLYASAKRGSVGASFAALFVGVSSAICTLTFNSNHISPEFTELNPLSLADQFVWMQLFMVVLISTSQFFVVILAERDRARANIENKVHQRTEELTVALAQLDDALRKAETADNDKAVFFSFLCHELRNPLHVISNMANFLEDTHDGASTPQIKAIKSSSKYMLALVSDVLDLGRFEAGRVVLENLTVDIHSLLQTNFDCAAQLAASHQINFDADIDKSLPKWLSVDSVRIQQILNNLISNAFKFTPKGGRIHVEVRALKIFHGVNPQAAIDLLETSLSVRDRESVQNKHRRGLSVASSTVSDETTSIRSTASYKAIPKEYAHATSSSSDKWYKRTRKVKQQKDKQEEDDYFDVCSAGANEMNDLGHKNCKCSNCNGSETRNSSARTSIHETNMKRSQEIQSSGNITNISTEVGSPASNTRHSSLSSVASTFRPVSGVFSPTMTHNPVVSSPIVEEGGAEQEGEWAIVEVSVSDTGIGIDPAIVSKLFRPYAQAAVSTMREYGGSGLGLAITNQIVRLMGGSVYVETEIGKGSKFTFTVPLLVIKDPHKTSEPSPPPEIISPLSPALRHPSPPQTSPLLNVIPEIPSQDEETDTPQPDVDSSVYRILIVDDSSINRQILTSLIGRLLRKGAYAIDIATNGQEACDMCASNNNHYELIFMDIVMPVMNGWDACRQIRASGYTNSIVITTANQVTTDEAAAEIAAAGANDAISKPFSKEHIFGLLMKYGGARASFK